MQPFRYTAPENVQERWLSRRKTLPAAGLVAEAAAATGETVDEFGGLHSRSSSSGSSNWSKESPSLPPSVCSPQRTGSISSRINLPKTLADVTPVNPTMQAIRLQKKYPQVSQQEMFALIEKFGSVSLRERAKFAVADDVRRRGDSAIETDTPGRVPKTAVINALQASGDASYDRARETLKGVSVDASGKVELEDWVEVFIITLHSLCDAQRPFQLNVKLKEQAAPILPTKAGKVIVKGSNANASHTINEDERSEFTSHINGVRLSTLKYRPRPTSL